MHRAADCSAYRCLQPNLDQLPGDPALADRGVGGLAPGRASGCRTDPRDCLRDVETALISGSAVMRAPQPGGWRRTQDSPALTRELFQTSPSPLHGNDMVLVEPRLRSCVPGALSRTGAMTVRGRGGRLNDDLGVCAARDADIRRDDQMHRHRLSPSRHCVSECARAVLTCCVGPCDRVSTSLVDRTAASRRAPDVRSHATWDRSFSE